MEYGTYTRIRRQRDSLPLFYVTLLTLFKGVRTAFLFSTNIV